MHYQTNTCTCTQCMHTLHIPAEHTYNSTHTHTAAQHVYNVRTCMIRSTIIWLHTIAYVEREMWRGININTRTHNIHVHVYMYDVTVHCRATHYITATAIHYCVEEEECGGLKQGR